MKILLLALTFILTSCSKGRDEPLTNEIWKILSNTRLSSFDVSFKEKNIEVDEREFRKILKSLTPFKRINSYDGPYDWRLLYQGGKDPTTIYIKVEGESLIFRIREFVYKGGKSKVLKEIKEKI